MSSRELNLRCLIPSYSLKYLSSGSETQWRLEVDDELDLTLD